jgi:RNA polymerase sporulation-specific sigma factor
MKKDQLEALTSEELQALCAENSSDALAVLVKRYLPLVKSRVLSFFGQGVEFEDLVQEAYIGFLSAVSGFDPGLSVPFGSFAKLCVDRALGNYSRSRKHRESEHLTLNEELCAAGVSPESFAIIREDYLSVVGRAKSELSPLEYDVFCLYISGYRSQEISEILSVSVKSVDNAICRFKSKLKSVK